MFVAICRFDLILIEGTSLKEKRKVIRSIIDKLSHRFNISIAETGFQDNLRRAEIGIAVVSNEVKYLEGLLEKIVYFVEMNDHVDIVEVYKEIV